jgi:hypothetical protein
MKEVMVLTLKFTAQSEALRVVYIVDIIVSTDAFAGPEVSWLDWSAYELVVDAGREKADVGIADKELVGGNSPGEGSLEAIKVSVFVMKIVTGGSVKRVAGSASAELSRVLSTVVVKYIVCPFSVRV